MWAYEHTDDTARRVELIDRLTDRALRHAFAQPARQAAVLYLNGGE
ncbi:MAG TPA: hypothetical protein VFQ48_05070 [Pseudonocardiaceae bacterium]|nr:hypothetical protein [Pseudonocardiaceae bacterium]